MADDGDLLSTIWRQSPGKLERGGARGTCSVPRPMLWPCRVGRRVA